MSVFGFSTESTGGNADIVPILKYDARAGRVFRVDREQDASGSYANTPVDITRSFKALVDFENVEVGWINYNTGGQPHFALVPMGSALPPKPTGDHKPGVRFMLKLGKECGGDIREVSSTAKAFLNGIEKLYLAYQDEKAKNGGKLPVIVLEDTVPIKSGSGDKQSTNYQPIFKIAGWGPRGDLVFKPKAASAAPATAPASTPPATGATPVPPPVKRTPEPASKPEMAEADEFG